MVTQWIKHGPRLGPQAWEMRLWSSQVDPRLEVGEESYKIPS
jgi:hypothetical protein